MKTKKMSANILRRFNSVNKYKKCAIFSTKENNTDNLIRIPWEEYIFFVNEFSEFVSSENTIIRISMK